MVRIKCCNNYILWRDPLALDIFGKFSAGPGNIWALAAALNLTGQTIGMLNRRRVFKLAAIFFNEGVSGLLNFRTTALFKGNDQNELIKIVFCLGQRFY